MSHSFAAVRIGAGSKVHLGIRYSADSPLRTRCAAGGNRTADQAEGAITCILCLTRYPGDLYLFKSGRSRAEAQAWLDQVAEQRTPTHPVCPTCTCKPADDAG